MVPFWPRKGSIKKAQDRFIDSADFLQDAGCINTSPDYLIKRQTRCSPVKGGSSEHKALLQSHLHVMHCNTSTSSERQPAQEHEVSHTEHRNGSRNSGQRTLESSFLCESLCWAIAYKGHSFNSARMGSKIHLVLQSLWHKLLSLPLPVHWPLP